MKKKNLLMTAVAIIGFATITIAQPVPSYVPTTGLVGWWPFNGNANDESGNGNNGTVNGPVLTNDRFGNANKAYNFDGINDFISINHNQSLNLPGNNNSFSFSAWIKPNQSNQQELNILSKGDGGGMNSNDVYIFSVYNQDKIGLELANYPSAFWTYSNSQVSFNQWNHAVVVYDNSTNSAKFYINGLFAGQQQYSFNPSSNGDVQSLFFGKQGWNCNCNFMNGLIDDIGSWNRALTQQEITDLYNGCQLSVTTQPINQSVNIFNNAQFITASTDPLATYQWQTDLGFGFQNLNSVGQYSGTTNDTLTITNTTLSNNNQPFRCIISSGSCTDTSAVAILTVVNNVGINEISQSNLFSVYPNPANSHINVKADVTLLGSDYTIYDNTGKLVLSGKINSENTVIELGNLSGGIYIFNVGGNLKQTFKVIKE